MAASYYNNNLLNDIYYNNVKVKKMYYNNTLMYDKPDIVTVSDITKYSGSVPELSTRRSNLAAANVGSYALFVGGTTYYGTVATVDAYDTSLTRTVIGLASDKAELAATSIDGYAIFAGGSGTSGGYGTSVTVDAFDASLTRRSLSGLSVGKVGLAGAQVNNYAIFAGGYRQYNGTFSTAEGYNRSLTKVSIPDLTFSSQGLAATSIDGYAIFAGGLDTSNNVLGDANAFNSSLTRITVIGGIQVAYYLAATSIDGYAIFAGGNTSGRNTVNLYTDQSSTVTAYDTALTRSTLTELSVPRQNLAATSVGNFAIFAGGYYDNKVTEVDVASPTVMSTVDVYNSALTRSTLTELSVPRQNLAATSVGNFAIFAGGINLDKEYDVIADSAYKASVDVYQLA